MWTTHKYSKVMNVWPNKDILHNNGLMQNVLALRNIENYAINVGPNIMLNG